MAVTPFIITGGRTLDRLRERAANVLDTWSGRWLPQPVATTVDCSPAEALAGALWGDACPDWIAVPVGNCAFAWFPAADMETLRTLLFGEGARPLRRLDGKSSLAEETAASALADLARRLSVNAATGPAVSPRAVEDGAPPPDIFRYGSGAVVVSCRVEGAVLSLVLSAGLVAEIAAGAESTSPQRPRPGNPLAGLSSRAMELQAWIGEAEIDLGTLQTIAVGDVVRLETRLDQPLQIRSSNGGSVCRGYLGTADGSRAVELLSEIGINGDGSECQHHA